MIFLLPLELNDEDATFNLRDRYLVLRRLRNLKLYPLPGLFGVPLVSLTEPAVEVSLLGHVFFHCSIITYSGCFVNLLSGLNGLKCTETIGKRTHRSLVETTAIGMVTVSSVTIARFRIAARAAIAVFVFHRFGSPRESLRGQQSTAHQPPTRPT